MDQLEVMCSNAISKRARLQEEFLVAHAACWPGVSYTAQIGTLTSQMKCSCGGWLETTILVKVIPNGYDPRPAQAA